MSANPVYGRGRYPKILEKGKCRGCGEPVPPNRQTWCSTKCFKRHYPAQVRIAVWQRDGGICQICMTLIGDPKYSHRKNAWEMDHVIAFKDGGMTVVENCRVLCIKCHKERTAKWRKERSKRKPPMSPQEKYNSSHHN